MPKKIEDKGESWSHWLQTKGRGEAFPLTIRAAEIALKERSHNLTVLDLGAGTGRNSKPLLEKGATVYAYDAEPESIKILQEDFKTFVNSKKLYVEQAYFEDIPSLPTADMIIAFYSLPFMKEDQFPVFWKKIEDALPPKGIFVGAFFGERESIISAKRYKLFTLPHEKALNLFANFQIIVFNEDIEYNEEMSKERESDQYLHIYRVIAKKKAA